MERLLCWDSLRFPFNQYAVTMCVGYIHGRGVYASVETINNKRHIWASEIGQRPVTYPEAFGLAEED